MEHENRVVIAENINFPKRRPCRVKTRISAVDVVPYYHFAPTIEIILTENLSGNVYIGAQEFTVNEKQDAFFIPPGIVHNTMFKREGGQIHVFKISLEMLSEYVDIAKLLASRNHTFFDIPYHQTEGFAVLKKIIFQKIAYDGDELAMVHGVINLFEYLDGTIGATDTLCENGPTDEKIQQVIQWTQENIEEHITVEDAAKFTNYSKYYFCRVFKENVGISYLSYVNTLKIKRCVELMKEGKSATYCCYECGFTSLTYFLRLFKKVTGYTTKEYRKLLDSEKTTL